MSTALRRRQGPVSLPRLRNAQSAMEQRFGPSEYRPIDQIKAYAKNPRKHPERQIVQLMASIGEFGFVMPVLVDAEDTIIAGHACVEAARRLGMTEVPVLVAEHWTRAQVQAYRLADNQLASVATWDVGLLQIELENIIEIGEVEIEALGWNTAEIDVILDVDATAPDMDSVDDIPALPLEPSTRAGDVWILNRHRLLCGSSLELECWNALMAGETGAMSLSDPPYNVPINGHVSGSGRHAEFAMASGEMSTEEFIAFNTDWLSKSSAVLKDGAVVMSFMDHAHLFELMSAARAAGLKHVNICVWAKTNGGMGTLYRAQHEMVLVLRHGTAQHFNAVELGKHGRYRTNVWQAAGANGFSKTRAQDLADHPTVKPVALLVEAIRDVTRQNEIVVDAFAGSGSTILACERARRVCRAIEIEPRYVDVAIRRWEAMTGCSAVLGETGETHAAVAERRRSAAQ